MFKKVWVFFGRVLKYYYKMFILCNYDENGGWFVLLVDIIWNFW